MIVWLGTMAALLLVVAGFLWLLESGLTHDGTGYPAVSFGRPHPSHPQAGLYLVSLAIGPEATSTTAGLTLSVETNGTWFAGDPPPSSCSWEAGDLPVAFNADTCGAPDAGWYAVLAYPNGLISSVYNGSAAGFAPAVPLASGTTLWIVSAGVLAGQGALLSAWSSHSPESNAQVTL